LVWTQSSNFHPLDIINSEPAEMVSRDPEEEPLPPIHSSGNPPSEPLVQPTHRTGIDEEEDEELPEFPLLAKELIVQAGCNDTAPAVTASESANPSPQLSSEGLTLRNLFYMPQEGTSSDRHEGLPQLMREYWRHARNGHQVEVSYHDYEANTALSS
jgi:hypothetical protein